MQDATSREKRRVLIAFIDLAGFARVAEVMDDDKLAGELDTYYERVAELAAGAGGTVVKFIGDGALIIFPPERADDAVTALLAMRDTVTLCGTQMVVKVHAGEVVCGSFGGKADKRFDIIGGEVNVTARLPTKSFALSAEAFRELAPETRQQFKKHPLPITYIPTGDRGPTPMTKL